MKSLFLFFLLAFATLTQAAPVPSERYVITLEIRQSHVTLDLWEHVKDSANAIRIEIPVDKQFYDDVREGETLKKDFRTASLLIRGSFGSWKVRVVEKKVVRG